MVRKEDWHGFSFLKCIEAHFVAQHVVNPGECSMCTQEECVFCCFWMECFINIKSIWSKEGLCFLIDFSVWIDVSWCAEVPHYYHVTVSFSLNCGICLIYWGALVLGSYVLKIVLCSWIDPLIIMASLSSVTVFILKSILSEMNIVTPPLFWFPFAWNTFFYLITFSLYVSLSLKLVSCRQHIYGCCVCIYSASLCLLSHAFNPFTFKVIIDMYVSIAISLIILCFFIGLF